MQRVFHGLVNGSFGDPTLYVESGGYGTLFDCGHLLPLSEARIHRTRDLFISHAHMDHFFGFDWLLRCFLGADRRIRIFGPEGIAARVGARLDGYTWNIEMDFAFEAEVHELAGAFPRAGRTVTRFRVRHGLERGTPVAAGTIEGGVAWETAKHRVLATPVDHGTPALAYRYEQKLGVRVKEDAIAALGLARGPWLRRFKGEVLCGAPPETPFEVEGRTFALGELARRIGIEERGTTIAYIADTALGGDTRARLVALARGVDVLYCEGKYLEADRDRAEAAGHLTARQAAEIARDAGAGELVLFHPSPRYQDDFGRVLAEARAVFAAARFQTEPGFPQE